MSVCKRDSEDAKGAKQGRLEQQRPKVARPRQPQANNIHFNDPVHKRAGKKWKNAPKDTDLLYEPPAPTLYYKTCHET